MFSIEKNSKGIQVRPTSGRFRGQIVAKAEKAEVVGPYHACRFRRVWGLMILNDKVHEDVRLLRDLSLLGGL